jgi:hypothetical protein
LHLLPQIVRDHTLFQLVTCRGLETQFQPGRKMQYPTELGSTAPVFPASERPQSGLRMHPGSGGKSRSRPGTKVHPRYRRGCKVRVKPGVIIVPAAEAEFGETRKRRSGTTGGCEHRGNLKLRCRERWRVRDSRRLGDPSVGAAEEAKIQGNLEIRTSAQPEDAGCEETRSLITGLSGMIDGPSNLPDHHT